MIAQAGARAVRIVTAVVVAGLLWLGVEIAAGLTLHRPPQLVDAFPLFRW